MEALCRVISIIILSILCGISWAKEPFNVVLQQSLKKYPAETTLSKQARQLRVGMNKNEVLKLLGRPTWADSCQGEPLAWSWKNGRCNPVIVTFDKNMKVTGYDEGRAECLDNDYAAIPADKYLCTNGSRAGLCG